MTGWLSDGAIDSKTRPDAEMLFRDSTACPNSTEATFRTILDNLFIYLLRSSESVIRSKDARRRRAPFFSCLAAAALFLATICSGRSETILQTHKSFGASGFFADAKFDDAYVYTNPRDFVYVGYFYSNNWIYFSDWHTEEHLGIIFRQAPDDIIVTEDPGPYPPANAGKTYTVFQQTAVPTYNKSNDRKLGGDQTDCTVGMARYSADAMLASLNVVDTPFRYTPGRGPTIDFTVSYSQQNRGISTDSPNLGPNWTFNWLSYIVDDPNNQAANVAVLRAGGGVEAYSGLSSTSTTSLPDPQSHAILVRTSSSPIRYENGFPMGPKWFTSTSKMQLIRELFILAGFT